MSSSGWKASYGELPVLGSGRCLFALFSPLFALPLESKQLTNVLCPQSLLRFCFFISPCCSSYPAAHPEVKPWPRLRPHSSPHPLPDEDEGRSPFGLRLQGQHPLAFATLLLVGRPVSLLTLGATVARHLAATADVELPELWRDQEHKLPGIFYFYTLIEVIK